MKKRSVKSGFTLTVTRFAPVRRTVQHSVTDVPTFRELLSSVWDQDRLVVCLDRDEGETGSVWVHLTDDRAWVTHFQQLGGTDSYCKDMWYHGPDELIGFLLDNGQLDEIHRGWTVTREEGFNALEHFLRTGERNPALCWVQEPSSLQELA